MRKNKITLVTSFCADGNGYDTGRKLTTIGYAMLKSRKPFNPKKVNHERR